MKRQTLIELKQSAMESCIFRGHSMLPWECVESHPHRVYRAVCGGCRKAVFVEAFPAPNGIEIGGEAVALGCND